MIREKPTRINKIQTYIFNFFSFLRQFDTRGSIFNTKKKKKKSKFIIVNDWHSIDLVEQIQIEIEGVNIQLI